MTLPVHVAPASTPSALIFAAGRGQRMRPLTDHTPKPLLHLHGKPMIEWHIEALARAGVRRIAINTAWLEEQFPAQLGDGRRFGVTLHYSMEGRDHGQALETAGGMAKALPWLTAQGEEAFWMVSGDIHCPDFHFDAGTAQAFLQTQDLAKLWVVPNPPFHPQGDFGIAAGGRGLFDQAGPDGRRWTYGNLGLCRPALVQGVPPDQPLPLRPVFQRAMAASHPGFQVSRSPKNTIAGAIPGFRCLSASISGSRRSSGANAGLNSR